MDAVNIEGYFLKMKNGLECKISKYFTTRNERPSVKFGCIFSVSRSRSTKNNRFRFLMAVPKAKVGLLVGTNGEQLRNVRVGSKDHKTLQRTTESMPTLTLSDSNTTTICASHCQETKKWCLKFAEAVPQVLEQFRELCVFMEKDSRAP